MRGQHELRARRLRVRSGDAPLQPAAALAIDVAVALHRRSLGVRLAGLIDVEAAEAIEQRPRAARPVTVVRVDDISSKDYVERDLMLIRVKAPAAGRSTVRELAEIFRGRIVDVGREEVIIEIAGTERKIEAFVDLMRPLGIIELVRTGRIAMVRSHCRNSAPAAE